MNLIVDNMQWIMLVSGLLTLTTLQGLFAPNAVMQSMFGEAVQGAGNELVVRNWAGLIAGGGAALIAAAFVPEWRPIVLIYIGAGKLLFIALVLSRGFFKRQAAVAVVADSLMVALFAAYLIATLSA